MEEATEDVGLAVGDVGEDADDEGVGEMRESERSAATVSKDGRFR